MNVQNRATRQPRYLPTSNGTLFGWVHRPHAQYRDLGTVICNPLGVEYMAGHRTIRHLGDRLAAEGISTLRFDYAGTGDSSDLRSEGLALNTIVSNIHDAADFLRESLELDRIALIGIGLGATFATLAASAEPNYEQLVLWNPTVNGKRFVREQKLLSDLLTDPEDNSSRTIDAAGVVLTNEFQVEFKHLNLADCSFDNTKYALILDQLGRKGSDVLINALATSGIVVDHLPAEGYEQMMAQPTETVVPLAALDSVAEWLAEHSNAGIENQFTEGSLSQKQFTSQFDHTFVEHVEEFGEPKSLFGIATINDRLADGAAIRRAHVFLNCGSEHHAGPHRMYTRLARLCVGPKCMSFRFDLEGIGDSPSCGNNEDNNAYSPVAVDDMRSALQFLSDKYQCREFVISGICAGAYHSFLAVSEIDDFNIVEANLVNPLVFEWNYDDPEDHLRLDALTYKSSIKNADSWKRLVRGDIDFRRLFRSSGSYIASYAKSVARKLAGSRNEKTAGATSTRLKKVADGGRKINLVLSDGDPGLQLMQILAPRETRALLKSGVIVQYGLTKSNHGLSKKYMQDQLIRFFADKYGGDHS